MEGIFDSQLFHGACFRVRIGGKRKLGIAEPPMALYYDKYRAAKMPVDSNERSRMVSEEAPSAAYSNCKLLILNDLRSISS